MIAADRRTVVTLASVPGRNEHIVPALETLLAQGPDQIYVWIPRWFRRERRPGTIPPELARFNREHPTVHVELVDDLGPISKLLPVLRHETDPRTRIVVTDDDTLVRHEAWLSELVGHLGPRSAVGYSGFHFLKHAQPWRPAIANLHLEEVDVLEGYCGYALERGWLDHGLESLVRAMAERWDENLEILCADDLIVSCYLQRIGIATRIIFTPTVHRFNIIERASYTHVDALHLRNGGAEANLETFVGAYERLRRLVEAACPAGAALVAGTADTADTAGTADIADAADAPA